MGWFSPTRIPTGARIQRTTASIAMSTGPNRRTTHSIGLATIKAMRSGALIAAVLGRTSAKITQGHNGGLDGASSELYLLADGYALRINDEQGTSGGRLSARKVMRGILERLIAHESHRIAVTERAQAIRQAIDEPSKSLRWKARARIGRHAPWYELPEEVAGNPHG